MDEEKWVKAACQVLSSTTQPKHYADIKRCVLEQRLIQPGLKSTLEMALFRESQKEEGRVYAVEGKPGVFALATSPARLHSQVSEKGRSPLKAGLTSTKSSVPESHGPSRPPNPSLSQNGTAGLHKRDKYHAKYCRLKRLVKNSVFLNAAICDEVVRLEEKVTRVKDERRFLLKRLLQQQALSEVLLHQSLVSQPSSQQATPTSPASSSLAPPPSVPAPQPPRPSSQSVAQLLGEVEKRKKKSAGTATAAAAAASSVKPKKKGVKEVTIPEEKVTKTKKGKVVKRFVTPIPLDNTGRPIFPIELGTLTVYCLGEIIPKAGYSSPETIFPVGFCSTREFISIQNPLEKCLYTCKVYDGNQGPKFELSAEDCSEHVIAGSSPNDCHVTLLQAINASLGQDAIPLETLGAEFFGLSHPTIQNLIQYCPGAKKCHGYRWQKFEIAKDGAPHIENQATVNVEILLVSQSFRNALLAWQQRSAARSGSLRTLLTGDMMS